MSPSAEEHLKKAVTYHQTSEFKKGIKEAEQARKKFKKEGRMDRAIEALRVMGDCTLNARELNKAMKIYENLLEEGVSISNLWYQAAAHWGLGQVSLHKMEYSSAVEYFRRGLGQAQSVADNWYTAWNAFGLGNALRGIAQVAEAKKHYDIALGAFHAANQTTFVTWVEKALKDIGAIPEEKAADFKIWLCPLCGSKLTHEQAAALQKGNIITCAYCGTAVG